MYIKQLRLCESEPEINTIREISFKMGINLIVDNSTKNINSTIINKGNSVGKTTVLKIIDLCLGSTKKKYIYTDYELGSENINLKTYIFQKKVYAELLVVDNLDSPCIKHLLKVELFRNGKRFIDDIPKSTELYNNELNTIFFNNHCNKPTFRQLIKLFVRIEQTKDNDKFLRYLHTNTTDIQYENIYSYLFRFQSQKISNELLSVKNNIKNFKDALKEQQKINNIKGIDIIDQRLADISQECINIRNRLDNMVDIERLQENSKYIEKIQLQYTSLSDEINLLEFRKNKISKIINNATAELNNRIDIKMLKNLYNETFINFTNINKQFQDLISFNEQLIDNKISYFKNQLNKIDSKLKNSYKSKKNLFNINKDIITLIENNKLEKYYKLQNELEEYTNEKGKLEQIKNIFDTLNQNLVKEENKLKNLENTLKPTSDIIKIFNEAFTDFSYQILKEKYYLYNTESSFPFAVDNQHTGLSTGTKKSIIAAFDLAYQVFAKKMSITCPGFIIHDVLETIDQYGLKSIVNICNKINCQYIIAVLYEKIQNNDAISDIDIRLTLSDTEKLFKI